MRKLLFVLLLLVSLTNCKKIKEDITEKKVLDFITDGRWRVTEFSKNSISYTGDFTGFEFQFKTNNYVDAIKNGTVQKTGTWLGDATNLTITAAFPSDTAHPLPFLNGVWKLVDGGDNFTKATRSENGELSTLTLEKV